jgi:hypothetical protein
MKVAKDATSLPVVKVAIIASLESPGHAKPQSSTAADHAGYRPQAALLLLAPCPNVQALHTIVRSLIFLPYAWAALDCVHRRMSSKLEEDRSGLVRWAQRGVLH